MLRCGKRIDRAYSGLEDGLSGSFLGYAVLETLKMKVSTNFILAVAVSTGLL